MKPSVPSWKSRFIFPRSETTSASVLTRRGQVADRTLTLPLTLPQTLPSQEGRKSLFLERYECMFVLKEYEVIQGNFLRFDGRDN
jgi:hypothetical protein